MVAPPPPSRPQHHSSSDATPDALESRVRYALERIRPAIQADGGDIELVGVSDNGVASIRLLGACIGCPSSDITLTMGVERTLKAEIPEITGVRAVE